eukprot:jgi/Mesvir1/27428/Mv07220-RA.1
MKRARRARVAYDSMKDDGGSTKTTAPFCAATTTSPAEMTGGSSRPPPLVASTADKAATTPGTLEDLVSSSVALREGTATAEQVATTPTLGELVSTPGLGELIVAYVPLADRVRLRALSHGFKAAVDASLQAVQKIDGVDLAGLDGWGHSHGDVLCWLARKCPNVQELDARTSESSVWLLRHWWKLPAADLAVTRLASLCRQLHRLELHECKGVRDSGLLAVAANCGNLRYLDIGGCKHVTDAGVSAIAANCRHLEHLDLWRIPSVTDGSIVAVGAHCPALRHLDVGRTSVGDAGIIGIARGCPELRALDVTDCADVSDDGLVAIAENCRLLEWVKYMNSRVGDRGIAAIVSHCVQLCSLLLEYDDSMGAVLRLQGPDSCRNLRSIGIYNCFIGASPDLFMSLTARCSTLTMASLLGFSATDANLEALATNCPHLEVLSIHDAIMVSDAGVLAVAAHCRQLRVARMEKCERVTDVSMAEIARCCPGLTELQLQGSYTGNTTMLAIARHCPGLRKLDISGCPPSLKALRRDRHARDQHRAWREVRVKDDGLAAVLQHCLQLESLNLEYCQGLSDRGVRVAGDSCKKLEELNLCGTRGCQFTARGLMAMTPQLVALETFDAYDCAGMTDAVLVAMASHCPRLKNVDVSGCPVGDEGVTALAQHCGLLSQLTVAFCRRVTFVGIAAVTSKCKALRWLCAVGCTVTTSDVQRVRDACPHLERVAGPDYSDDYCDSDLDL